MRRTGTFLLIAIMMLPLAPTRARAEEGKGCDVYILRHGETMGNVTGDYSEENQRTFSPKGRAQVAGIAEKLKDFRFDHIVVSPAYRTQQTILPYLQAQDCVAEIWPEVEECCCTASGEEPAVAVIPLGGEIEIVDPEHFRLRAPEANRHFAPTSEAEAMTYLRRGVDMLLERYGQSGESVLIVNHSCSGSRIMEMLLGLTPKGRFPVNNATVMHLHRDPDGPFKLLVLNDEPFTGALRWAQQTLPRGFKAGQELAFRLKAKFDMGPALDGKWIEWRVLGPDGALRASGTEPSPSELSVPTCTNDQGRVCKLVTMLYQADKLEQEWEQPFLVPSYLDLCGTWRIKEGDEEAWAAPDLDDSAWRWTEVPGGWERDALPEYDGTAWYRCSFSVSEECLAQWDGKAVGLVMGAIDDADVTYLNGTELGRMGEFPPAEVTAWDQPRIYTLDRALLKEENVLAVRVSDWTGGGGIWQAPVAIGPVDELQKAVSLRP